jgi:hypothetical protein
MIALAACDGVTASPDAAARDAATLDSESDAAVLSDDAAAGDAAPSVCPLGCETGYVCIDSQCLLTCDADVPALEAALAPELQVVFAICDTEAIAYAVPRDTLHELRAWEGASGTTLSFGYRSDSTGPFYAVLTVAPAVPAGVSVVPSSFLSMGHSGPVVFGYTTSESGSPGGVYAIAAPFAGDPLVVEIDAPGNRDAAVTSDLSSYLVVADALGVAADGPGVYLGSFAGDAPRLVLTNVGVPRSIALGDDYALVGASPGASGAWPDGTTGPRVLAVLLSDLLGPSPIDAFADARVTRLELPEEVEDLEGFGFATIARDASTGAIAGIDVRTVRRPFDGASAPEISAPERWAEGSLFQAITPAGYGTALLRHAHGVWFVRRP